MTTAAPTTLPPTSLAPTTCTPCDDFFTGSDGDPLNPSKWSTYAGSPDIQSNTAELSDGDIVISASPFPSDFHVRVSFALQAPPAVGVFNANLYAWFDNDHYIAIGAAINGATKSFVCMYKNGAGLISSGAVRSNDTGKLGIERSGNTFRAYYADGSGAETDLVSATVGSAGNAFSILLYVVKDATCPGVTCRFDNYRVFEGCAITTLAPTTLATSPAPTTFLTTLAPTTAAPTTLAPTTLAPTWPPFTRHPEYDYTYNVLGNGGQGVLEMEITISGQSLSYTYVCDGTELVMEMTIDYGGIPRSVLVDADPLEMEMTISGIGVCNDQRSNWIGWSKIGEANFALDHVNDAGFKPMVWSGYVYQVLKLGQTAVVYGSGGVTVAFPVREPMPTFGFKELLNFGIKNKTAVAGDEFVHFCISRKGELYKITKEGPMLLGYEEFLTTLTNPVLTWDPVEQRLHISDASTGYIYNDSALTGGRAGVSGIYRVNDTSFQAVGPADVVTLPVYIVTDAIDFGHRGLKAIEAVQFDVISDGALYAAYDYRYRKDKDFKTTRWTTLNHNGVAHLKCSAVEFRIRLKALDWCEFDLSQVRIHFKNIDRRFSRDVQTPYKAVRPEGGYDS